MVVVIIGVACRRDGGQPIQLAAQDHDDQPGIAAVGGACEFRQIGPGGDRGAAEQQRAARGRECAAAFAATRHCCPWWRFHWPHLLWNSGDINNSASACCRLSARWMV